MVGIQVARQRNTFLMVGIQARRNGRDSGIFPDGSVLTVGFQAVLQSEFR